MKKFAYFIIILVVLAGGYYFYAAKNKQAVAPTVEDGTAIESTDGSTSDSKVNPEPAPSLTPTPTSTSSQTGNSEGTFSGGEGETMAPDVLVVQVDYDGSAYSPKTVDIKLGDIVIFKNNSEGLMWPASAPHPVHTDYPEFDSKVGISAGGKWQFKFDKVGEWKYHDHLNPSAWGTISVK